ncbi:hypothetical protein, partial [Holospora obtusa]|uniref:hypothetical protein n=1 Tax=Holospora obtusa TaxID=49893 RepID=UPI0012EC9F5C
MNKKIILSLICVLSLGSKSFSVKESQQHLVQESQQPIGFEPSNENLSKIVNQLKGVEIMDADSYYDALRIFGLDSLYSDYGRAPLFTKSYASFLCALELLLRNCYNFSIEAVKNVLQDIDLKSKFKDNTYYVMNYMMTCLMSNKNNLDIAKMVINILDFSFVLNENFSTDLRIHSLINTILRNKEEHSDNAELAELCLERMNLNAYKNFDPQTRSLTLITSILNPRNDPVCSEKCFKSMIWGDDFLKVPLFKILDTLRSEEIPNNNIVKEFLQLSNWRERIQKEKIDISVYKETYNTSPNNDNFLFRLVSDNPLLELLLEGVELNHCFVGEKFHREYTDALLKSLIYVQSKELVEQLCSRIQFFNEDIPKIWDLCVDKLDYLKKNQFKDADTTGILSLLLDQGGGEFKNFYEDEDLQNRYRFLFPRFYENKDLQNRYGLVPPKSHEEK